MNKEELLKEISKTEEHLANMKKMLEECNYKRWEPKKGEKYWWVGGSALSIMTSSCASPVHYLAYNCFKTKEEAEQEREKILVRRMLEDIARRLNKGEKIDWKGAYQDKYYIYLDTETDELIYGESIWSKDQGTGYCLDQDFLDVAIQEISEERLKKYLRGE